MDRMASLSGCAVVRARLQHIEWAPAEDLDHGEVQGKEPFVTRRPPPMVQHSSGQMRNEFEEDVVGCVCQL